MKIMLGGALALALVSAPVTAQVAPVVAQQQAGSVLGRGAEVPLRTLAELNSSDFKVGDKFDLEVAEAVVIPVGSRAVGEVTKRSGKGMWGRSGKLETKLLYVMIANQKVAISGSANGRGKGGTAGAVGASLFLLPAGFFITGKAARIPAGTRMTAYLEQDVPVLLAPVAPAAEPLVRPAAVLTPAAATN